MIKVLYDFLASYTNKVSFYNKLIPAIIFAQAIGAFLLIASFTVELWLFELLVSFTTTLCVILFLGLFSTTVSLVIQKSFTNTRLLFGILGITWLAGVYILQVSVSYHNSIPTTHLPGNEITFATFNKLYSNSQINKVAQYLNTMDIDIIALQEIRASEVSALAEYLDFEHTYISRPFTTAGGTSVALLSRFPFETIETIELETNHPVIRALVHTPHTKVAVYSVHIPVPSSNILYQKRNAVLASLSNRLLEENSPVIIGGDFNTTRYSPALKRFNESIESKIKPVGINSWPACSWYGFGAPFCIRIDHIYTSKEATVSNFQISPEIGSDHRVLVTDISI